MKQLAPIGSLALSLLLASAAIAQNAPVREVLSNDSIISLTKAGFKESTIITLIRNSPVSFDITTAKLVQLKKSGVSEKVITTMLERQNLGSASGLSDEEFFRQGDAEFFKDAGPIFKDPSSGAGGKDPGTKENETGIFGSRSGARGQSQSRGMGSSGSAASEGETLGSASVKIIRPPSETGGAGEPKLERAPKLDNKAILELIQAGFSEGTILRKIERSQVDFDLSPKALAELRKNHVSESIIKAMTEAMGVEAR
jgi:hypothetical protein